MSNELPDLDENVSFVVDGGSPVGPMPMRSIIDSIRSGERAPDVLVWWAGATDWSPFSSDRGLFELLQALPATNQPPPPTLEVMEEVGSPEFSAPDDGGLSFSADEEGDAKFPEPEVTAFSIWPEDDASTDDVSSENDEDGGDTNGVGTVAGFSLELGEPHPLGEFEDVDDFDADALDEADEDEVDAFFAAGPRAMHPSSGWGVDDDESDESAAIDEDDVAVVEFSIAPVDEEVAELDEVAEVEEVEELEESDEVAEVEEANEAEEAEESAGQLTGLFGAPGLRVQPADVSEFSESGLSEEAITARQMLQNVGARIDALASSTRQARDFEPAEVAARATTQVLEESTADEQLESEASETVASADAVEAVESTGGSWQAVEGKTGLDERFAEMVQLSTVHQRRLDWALRVEELLLSACITAVVDKGFVLLDLDTNDTLQRATFDHNDDSRQLRVELSPLSSVNAAGDPVDRLVKVTMAWTQTVEDADDAFATVRAEASDEPPSPGEIRCEANMVASSATTMVDLVWAAHEYVREDHSVDRANLELSLMAIMKTLESRWAELFSPVA